MAFVRCVGLEIRLYDLHHAFLQIKPQHLEDLLLGAESKLLAMDGAEPAVQTQQMSPLRKPCPCNIPFSRVRNITLILLKLFSSVETSLLIDLMAMLVSMDDLRMVLSWYFTVLAVPLLIMVLAVPLLVLVLSFYTGFHSEILEIRLFSCL